MARILTSAASGALRDSHYVLNAVTGLYERTTLLESSRTNTFTKSAAFDHADWTKANATVSANAASAPDGTVTADRIVEAVAGGASTNHGVHRTNAATTSSTNQAFSVFAKAAGRSWIALVYAGRDGVSRSAFFNLATGAVGTTSGATARITSEGPEGWWRCSMVATSGSGATAEQAYIYLATGDGGSVYIGDGASGVDLWGAQWEVDQDFETSYVATDTGSVTRSADSLSYPFTLPAQAMSVYAKFIERGASLVANARVLHIGASAGTGPLFALYSTGSVYRAAHDNNTLEVNSTAGVGVAIGATVELLANLASDGAITLTQSINGAAPTTAAASAANTISAWSDDVLWINSVGSSNIGCNAFLTVKVASGTRTLQEMRDLHDMAQSVLVLNAGDADAIFVDCSGAQEGEATDIGGTERAFAGNKRVMTRDQKRAWTVTTDYLEAAERDAINTLIADNAPIPCSGILFGNETVTCTVKATNQVMHSGTQFWLMSLRIEEV